MGPIPMGAIIQASFISMRRLHIQGVPYEVIQSYLKNFGPILTQNRPPIPEIDSTHRVLPFARLKSKNGEEIFENGKNY